MKCDKEIEEELDFWRRVWGSRSPYYTADFVGILFQMWGVCTGQGDAKMNCPECGSEMQKLPITRLVNNPVDPSDTEIDGWIWWCPKCGHEAKVGEKDEAIEHD